MNKLRTWFFGLQQRERRVLTVGAIAVAVLILLFGLLLPLQGAVSGLNRRNAIKREDLVKGPVKRDGDPNDPNAGATV